MVKQLSIFVQNKSGKLAVSLAVLRDNGIDIRALTIAENDDFEGAVNDVGIIYAPQPFLLAVYTQDTSEAVVGEVAALLTAAASFFCSV